MELDDQEASSNIEDRRGMGMGGLGGGLGIGGIAVAALAYFLGFDPGTALRLGQVAGEQIQQHQLQTRPAPHGAPADPLGQFSAKVLGSTERVWSDVFAQSNARYRAPTLVLYERAVQIGRAHV